MTPTPATRDIITLGVFNTTYCIVYLSQTPKDPVKHGPRVSIAQDVQTLRSYVPQYLEYTSNLQDRSSDIHSQSMTSRARTASLELAAVAEMARRRIRMLGRTLGSEPTSTMAHMYEMEGTREHAQGRRNILRIFSGGYTSSFIPFHRSLHISFPSFSSFGPSAHTTHRNILPACRATSSAGRSSS
jgi:hypothetical protein